MSPTVQSAEGGSLTSADLNSPEDCRTTAGCRIPIGVDPDIAFRGKIAGRRKRQFCRAIGNATWQSVKIALMPILRRDHDFSQ